ncbi:hypothetical protein Tco_0689520 [Tanacetum coccineum]
MENANSPPTNDPPVLSAALRANIVQELNELHAISAYIDSRLENIDQFLNGFTQVPNKIDVNNLEPDDESVDTPLTSPFLDSDDDSDNGEVLNELTEYDNIGQLRRQEPINCFNGNDLAFQCVIVFKNFVAYFDPFLPMNIITRKAYNTIMVEGLESTVLEDIGDFILGDMAEVVIGRPFRKTTRLEYDCAKGLMLYLMRRSSEVLRKFHWTILGGRFDQLSHVSSPLLSKLGEYFLALGWHLEDLYVTLAHLEKKRTRLRTYTKSLRRKAFSAWRRHLECMRRRLDHAGTASENPGRRLDMYG